MIVQLHLLATYLLTHMNFYYLQKYRILHTVLLKLVKINMHSNFIQNTNNRQQCLHYQD
nr:MAG TPA: hypothetical protein [Caudoviricetes sp.]